MVAPFVGEIIVIIPAAKADTGRKETNTNVNSPKIGLLQMFRTPDIAPPAGVSSSTASG
jgi:hypothetical protein